jgi:4-amino-4-deoxychorismate lyase
MGHNGFQIRELSLVDLENTVREKNYPARETYGAMYSSWYGGIIKDPSWMMIPIDDHGFHRGDAVFEAIKCIDKKFYALDRHLERLQRSAEMIALNLPFTLLELRELAVATAKASSYIDLMLRLYVSRGPGAFTANPYDSIGTQVYMVATKFKSMSHDKYQNGVAAGLSRVAVKEGLFANVKSCNYLPNVMMKKEAVDRGLEFTVSEDENGFLAEGSTENLAIISEMGEFIVPGFARTLKGITVTRMMELAEQMLASGQLNSKVVSIKNANIKVEDVLKAREVMFFGTTLDCIAVTNFEGQSIGDGKPGPVARLFYERLKEDLAQGDLIISLK